MGRLLEGFGVGVISYTVNLKILAFKLSLFVFGDIMLKISDSVKLNLV